LLDWLIGLIHEPSSPVWFSNGVVRSVISSILGAAASAILIAPMTARWIAWDTARKWRPGRRFAFKELELGISTICNSLSNYSFVGEHLPHDIETMTLEDEEDRLVSCEAIYIGISGSYDELKKAYSDWAEVWSAPQASSIIAFIELAEELCRRVDDERELISRILGFEQDPNGLKYWKLATPHWIQQQKQPVLSVSSIRKLIGAVRASCGDRQLAKIFDENLQMLDKCNQVCIDRLQSASRLWILRRGAAIDDHFSPDAGSDEMGSLKLE